MYYQPKKCASHSDRQKILLYFFCFGTIFTHFDYKARKIDCQLRNIQVGNYYRPSIKTAILYGILTSEQESHIVRGHERRSTFSPVIRYIAAHIIFLCAFCHYCSHERCFEDSELTRSYVSSGFLRSIITFLSLFMLPSVLLVQQRGQRKHGKSGEIAYLFFAICVYLG